MTHRSIGSRARRGVAAVLCAGCLLGSGGQQPAPVTKWRGLTASGTITRQTEQHWHTPTLAAGIYQFDLTGTSGDADLYVRIGSPPTTQTYDCHPAKSGAPESCLVYLSQPAIIHVMVRGYAPSSTFKLVGHQRLR